MKSEKRKKIINEKKTRKEAAYKKTNRDSRYAKKIRLQARGVFSKTSPFYNPESN